jgi:hypothetical protein
MVLTTPTSPPPAEEMGWTHLGTTPTPTSVSATTAATAAGGSMGVLVMLAVVGGMRATETDLINHEDRIIGEDAADRILSHKGGSD